MSDREESVSIDEDNSVLLEEEVEERIVGLEKVSEEVQMQWEEAVVAELGYWPTNVLNVVANDSVISTNNNPAVLELYPLKNAQKAYKRKQRMKIMPFPTIYWLCSRSLKEQISMLEEEGYITILQQKVQDSEEYTKLFQQQHENYAKERWELLDTADLDFIQKHKENVIPSLRNGGIAGIRDFTSVKCLHTHYAHYVAKNKCKQANIIGHWVHELLVKRIQALKK